MHNGPIRDERIVEAVECCRPGSADVADPALAFLGAEMAADRGLEDIYERLQRLDARLAAAFQDVPVPEGLADRLLRQLAAAGPLEATGPLEIVSIAVEQPADAPLPATVAVAPRRVSRRWLLAAAVPLAAAAGLFVAFVVGLLRGPDVKEYTGSMVMEEAVALFMRELADPKTADHGPADARPKEYPFGRDVCDATAVQWRSIDDFAGQRGVAYDLPGPRNDTQATLYVVRCTVEDLPERPRPDLPECRYSTGNCYTLAWQDRQRGLLYVLVYNGREDDHRFYLKPPRPWA